MVRPQIAMSSLHTVASGESTRQTTQLYGAVSAGKKAIPRKLYHSMSCKQNAEINGSWIIRHLFKLNHAATNYRMASFFLEGSNSP